MHTLHNWNARRSSDAMTIIGTDENGHKVKVIGVKVLEPKDGQLRAVGRDGAAYGLAL